MKSKRDFKGMIRILFDKDYTQLEIEQTSKKPKTNLHDRGELTAFLIKFLGSSSCNSNPSI